MKKPILGMVIVLAAACAAGAQEGVTALLPSRVAENAVAFENTSAAQVNLFEPAGTDSLRLAASEPAAPEPAPAAAAPTPKFVFGDRDDYRWQLGLGVEFLRFRSSILNASIVGVNTTISYYTNSWFALEGNLVTAFGPPPRPITT